LTFGASASRLAALALCLAVTTGCDVWRSLFPPPVSGPDVRGEWQSGATVYRLETDGAKVTATFDAVSPEAQALGFKKGDLSFVGTRNGNFIQGEQVIRYPATIPCHRESGRRVPFMAMVADDGKRIILDWYNVSLNTQTCKDVGRTVAVTQLDRR
jgi:hypothetical protein